MIYTLFPYPCNSNDSSGLARLLITVQSGGRGPADIFQSVQEILTTFSVTVLNVSRYGMVDSKELFMCVHQIYICIMLRP